MIVNEFLKATRCVMPSGCLDIRPRVECADGFSISIQASELHYCEPRTSEENTEYEKVELAYPSKKEEMLLSYAEDEDDPINSVYGYVPVELVDKILRKHGDIISYIYSHGKQTI